MNILKFRAELKRKVDNGELSACSPFPGMDKPWTEEQKQRLNAYLGEVFGWSPKSNFIGEGNEDRSQAKTQADGS
jgi:hypothetical protein